jgi:hypothetical protein
MALIGNMGAPQKGSGGTMPNTMSAAQSAESGAPNAAKAAMAALVPFGKAAKRHAEQGTTQTITPWSLTANAQQQFLIPSYGYLSAALLSIAATGGAGVAATPGNDSPFNILANILLADVNGTPIINLDGYAAYLMRLYGGYRLFRPDTSTYAFSAISASGPGNFKLMHELYLEFSGHEGLGCLPNMDASAAYKLTLTYNAMTAGTGPNNVYGVVPTTPPTAITSVLEMLARGRPAPVDAYGNAQETEPPAPGTVGYWTSQSFPVVVGTNNIILTRVGNFIRNQILVFRDATGIRSNADSTGVTPTVLEYDWDAGQRYILNVASLRQLAFELNGFDAPAGVVPLQNTTDPDGIPVNESGYEWLPTVGATKLQLRFTSAAAGTLQVITNDVVPGQNAQF